MNQKKLTKALAVLIAVFISLSVCINAVDSTLLAMSDANRPVSPASLLWQKTYGGACDDRAFYSLPTQNGNFLVIGSSQSIVENTTVGWALMLDSAGNIVWNKTYLDGFGTELRFALSVEGGFLLVGNQFCSNGDVHGYVAKVDSEGNLQWETIVGSSNLDKIFSAAAAKDGYALFGLTYTAADQSNGWIVQLSSDGSVMWNKTYDASAFRSAVSTDDDGFVVAGTAISSGGDYDFALLKLDAAGNVVWQYSYDDAYDEQAHSIAKAPDGYVIVGDVDSQATSTDAHILKVDFNGNLMWQKTVGGNEADSPAYVTASKDGGYLVSGFTFSYGAGYRDFWLFKISDVGQVLWSCTQGTESYQEAYGVIEQAPDSYVMVGWTDPMGHPELVGKKTYDFYIVDVSVEPVGAVLSSAQLVGYLFLGLALASSWALISNLYMAKQHKIKQK